MNFNTIALWSAVWFFCIGHAIVGIVIMLLLCAGAFE